MERNADYLNDKNIFEKLDSGRDVLNNANDSFIITTSQDPSLAAAQATRSSTFPLHDFINEA